MPIIQGLVIGFGTAFLLGPVFFTLLKNALQFGRNAGIATAVGIIISDLIVISICFLATASLLESIKNEPYVKILGASILLIMGVRFVFWPSVDDASAQQTKKKGYFGYFLQGFLVNGVNPFVFVVWIGFIALGKSKFNDDDLSIFLASILIGIFITDVIKSFLAPKLRPVLRPQYLKKAYQFIGFLLLGFAARLIAVAIA